MTLADTDESSSNVSARRAGDDAGAARLAGAGGPLADPSIRQVVPELGKHKNATADKAKRLLGWSPARARTPSSRPAKA